MKRCEDEAAAAKMLTSLEQRHRESNKEEDGTVAEDECRRQLDEVLLRMLQRHRMTQLTEEEKTHFSNYLIWYHGLTGEGNSPLLRPRIEIKP